MNSWSFVDKVLYINLEERKDRKAQIKKELLKVMPKEKIFRFNAIKDSFGHIGCTKSHIACLEIAINNKYKNILIMEDDAIFNNYEEGYKLLKKLAKNPYDVITLGNVGAEFDKKTYKLKSGQTTTAYLVNSHYFQTLLDNYKEGLKLLQETFKMEKYCLDQYWKLLQKKDNWFIVHPALCIQSAGFSSICNQEVDYKEYFNIKK
jgi:glycosyl transferase family 25